jgi:hypothetical protein
MRKNIFNKYENIPVVVSILEIVSLYLGLFIFSPSVDSILPSQYNKRQQLKGEKMKQISDVVEDLNDYPLRNAQVEYMAALMEKYKSPQVLYKTLECSRFMVHHWRNGSRLMSLQQAYILESLLDERKIRYVNYLKKHWVAS